MRPWDVKRLFRFPSRTSEHVRADIDEEFAFHLDMRAEELMRNGSSETEARAQAVREFGDRAAATRNLARLGDRVDDRRRIGRFFSELWRDAALGVRLLRRSPGFAMVAILTLAIGIGANTAIYSVLDAAVLRPLPYPEPDRLVLIEEVLQDGTPNSVSGGAYLDWRNNQTRFEGLALNDRVRYNLRGREAPERLSGLEVSHEFFDVLGVRPLLGRTFRPDDDRPGGDNTVVVLTEELWRSRFGGDASMVGRTIVLDEVPRTVIGVVPAGAWMIRDDMFFVPAVLQPGTDRAARSPHWAMVIGRLAPGVSVAQADIELDTIKARLTDEYPPFKRNWSVGVRPVIDVIGGVTRTPLFIVLGAVSLVLLIACVNVANLVLARGQQRQQELAVRAAIGAGSSRLVRQVMAENLVLALAGGAAGIAVAYAGVGLLQQLGANIMPLTLTPAINSGVLLFSLIVTVGTGSLVGLLPALRARRPDLNRTLTSGGRGATSAGQQRTQAALIVAEVALTVVLLASAGLLLRSLANAVSADSGFEPERVLALDMSLPDATYESHEKRLSFITAVLERLRNLGGVETAGAGMAIPFSGGGYGEYFSRPGAPEEDRVLGRIDYVSPGYLEALGARLMSGRPLADADNRTNGPRVAVINATTAQRFFPDEDPVGRAIRIVGDEWQIVGVVADVVDRRLDLARGVFAYGPLALNTSGVSLVIRTQLPPLSLVERVRSEVARVDAGVAIGNPRALDQAMADSMLPRRVLLGLVGVFALVALALASVGLYGVMAYAVATRHREIGIRIAFGAARGTLVGDVLLRGLRLAGIGLAVGVPGAIVAARLLSSELYEVGGSDPVVISGTIGMVVVVTLVACLLPTWRAARVEPAIALRAE